ncbi:MAG TPA: hypothetical protein VHA35_22700 [Dongiaceae bacterium]|jgi:hypothetical protein|nr:hypothetical protein [Dongiaceae bacterium]
MTVHHASRRRLRAEAYGDWLGLAYRGLFYALAATPVWGAAMMAAIVWRHAHP